MTSKASTAHQSPHNTVQRSNSFIWHHQCLNLYNWETSGLFLRQSVLGKEVMPKVWLRVHALGFGFLSLTIPELAPTW